MVKSCHVTEVVTHRRQALADRIRLARKKTGLSQERFAARLGTSRRNVIRWESGQNKPGPHYQRRIAELTGQPIEDFTDDGDEEGD